ncbi:MAG: hypothetical protein WCI12_00865 [Actinomycetes bacterium]
MSSERTEGAKMTKSISDTARGRYTPSASVLRRRTTNALILVSTISGVVSLPGVGVAGASGVEVSASPHRTMALAPGSGQTTTGPQGPQGFRGKRGFQGYQGATGSQGTQGYQGYQGDTGSQGAQGYQGAAGTQGDTGSQGVQGYQGDTGSQGTQGYQGYQGDTGPQGYQGTDGAQGSQGPLATRFYGSFFDSTTQVNPVPDDPNPMILGTTPEANGVSIVAGSEITVANAGTYNIQFSSQFEQTVSPSHDVAVWLRLNGADVPWSNTNVTLQGNGATWVAAWNFVLSLSAGDEVQIVWASSGAGTQMLAVPASVTPPRPGTPSVIVTVQGV